MGGGGRGVVGVGRELNGVGGGRESSDFDCCGILTILLLMKIGCGVRGSNGASGKATAMLKLPRLVSDLLDVAESLSNSLNPGTVDSKLRPFFFG